MSTMSCDKIEPFGEQNEMDVEFSMYNNDQKVSYRGLHMRDVDMVDRRIEGMLEVYSDYSFKVIGDELIIKIAYDKKSKTIGNGEDKYPVNKKLRDEPLEKMLKNGDGFGNEWGKIKFMYKLIK